MKKNPVNVPRKLRKHHKAHFKEDRKNTIANFKGKRGTRPRPPTQDEPTEGTAAAKVVDLIDKGRFLSITEAARQLGVVKSTVSNAIRRWRPHLRSFLKKQASKERWRRYRPADGSICDQIMRRYEKQGLRNFSELARELGVTRQHVYRVLVKRCGYKPSIKRSGARKRSIRCV